VTRPAPRITAEGLVRIAIADEPGAPYVSYPDYLDYAAQTTSLQSLTAFTNGRVTITADSGSYAAMAVINQNLADALWPGQNPPGKMMAL
jgi:hypothetical protein